MSKEETGKKEKEKNEWNEQEEKEREKNGTEKKKRNRDNRKKDERQTKSMKKTRRKKKDREKEPKNRKWDLKSGLNGRYNNGDKKVSFLFSKKQTNERNEKERKVLWEEKENDERERGPELKRTELRQKMIISQKKNQRDQTKESKQGVEKTWKRHTLKRRRF